MPLAFNPSNLPVASPYACLMTRRWSLLEAVKAPFSGVHGSSNLGDSLSFLPVPGNNKIPAKISFAPNLPLLPALINEDNTSLFISGVAQRSAKVPYSTPFASAQAQHFFSSATTKATGRSMSLSPKHIKPPLTPDTYEDVEYSFSIDSIAMYSPPLSLIRFFNLSTICNWPSGRHTPTSPDLNQPSSVKTSAVLSGCLK